MIFRIVAALNLNLAAVAFDKLFRDEQTDACTHGTAGREEGVEHFRQMLGSDPDTVILDGQNDAVVRQNSDLPSKQADEGAFDVA